MLNRLWLVALSTVVAAGLSWLFPQLSAVVAGGAILIALVAQPGEGGDGHRGTRRRALRGAELAVSRHRAGAHDWSTAPDQRQRRRAALARLRSFASCFQVRVFATLSLVSHPRRAVAMPYRITARVRALWASESITIIAPASAASRTWVSVRSRRFGLALISSIVPVRAACSATRSMSIA